MYTGLHVKYSLLLSDFNKSYIFSTYFGKNTQISKFTKIRLVEAKFHAQFCESAIKLAHNVHIVLSSVYQIVLSLKLDNMLERHSVLWNYTKHSDGSVTLQSLVVTTRTARLNTNISKFSPDIMFMCSVRVSQGTSVISLYIIKWLAFLMEAHCVHCEVRTKTLYVIKIVVIFKGLIWANISAESITTTLKSVYV